MKGYENLPNVTFAPKDPDRHRRVSQSLNVKDDEPEQELDWIITWHGVRVRDKESASNIIKSEMSDSKTYIKVNPDYLNWVDQVLKQGKKEQELALIKNKSWWVRFKKWLSTLFPFRR